MTHSNYMDVEDLEVYKNSYVEKIRENIGAESPRAERAAGSYLRKQKCMAYAS